MSHPYAFAAALIYLPPLQGVFHTAGLEPAELALLALFPPLVWGSDELRRWALRRRAAPSFADRRPRRWADVKGGPCA